MDFPSFGDADGYESLGRDCARALQGHGKIFHLLYQPIRPIGAILYFGIPHLLSDDPLNAAYILLAMNMIALAIVVRASQAMWASPGRLDFRTMAVSFLALLVFLPGVPVALSNLPSEAGFFAGLALLLKGPPSRRTFVWAGLCFAVGGLIKQNSYLFGAVAVACFVAFQWRDRERVNGRNLAFLVLGSLPGVIQPAWVWMHSRAFWLFEPQAVAEFAPANRQPNVELFAFTDPWKCAYMTRLSGPTDPVTYVVIKIYKGLFHYYPEVYLGRAPTISDIVTVGPFLLARAYGCFALLVGFTAYLLWRGKVHEKVLVSTALLITLLTGWMEHTENRYYNVPRLLFWALAFVAAERGARALASRLRRPSAA